MHKQSGYIISVILFLFSGFILIAQQNNYYYPNFNTVPHLPSKMVYSVFKDSKGFMWFGTENGLYRWDGYDYKIYQNDPKDSTSISGNVISKILMEDDEGNIWIGTQSSGMNIYNPNTETFTHYSRAPEFQFDFDFNWVNIALVDRDGEIWLAAELSGGINNFDKSTGTISSYWQSTDDSTSWVNRISLIYEDRTGRLWVGSYKGLYIFNKSTKTYLNPSTILNIPNELNKCIINCIFEDQEGILWIGTTIGLFKLDILQNKVDHLKHIENDTHSLASSDVKEVYDNPNDGGKSLLILTRIGINKLDKSSGRVTRFNNDPEDPKYMAFNAMFDWLLDDNGILWAGSGFGAIRCNVNTNPFTEFQIGPFDQETYLYEAMTFLEDRKGNFWVGTDYSGLLKYDSNMNLIKRYNYNPNDPYGISYYMVFSLFEDVNDVLWVGTAFHLDVLDQKNNRFLRCSFPSDVPYSFIRPNDFHEDKSGILWVGTNSGLYYQQNQEILNTSFQLHHDFESSYVDIRTIAEDAVGNMWFGSSGYGLYLLIPENRDSLKLINIKHRPNNPRSISDDVIWSMYIDNRDVLWLGTASGLNKYDAKTKNFYHYNQENGLDAKFIYYIEGDDKNNLWLSTEKGIIRFSPLTDSTGHSKLLETADGVPFEENYHFKLYKGKDGKIYVGGRWASGNGFYCFHPDSLQDNKHIPEIVLTEFLINNVAYVTDSSITEIKHIKLKYDENFFSIKFAALDYINPTKNEYSYMLEGFDKDWIYCNNRRMANYTNVPPGDYLFRAKGSNNDGIWTEEGIKLKLSISPPPWKTWWAYLFYIIFITTILYFIFRYYFKRQQLLHKLALEQVQTEKLEELDRTKSRFFANISHEFRTPLTLILGPMEKLRTQISDAARNDLDMMLRNAHRLQTLINQLLSLSKLEAGEMKLQVKEVNIILLVKRYMQSFESLAKQKEIEFKFNSSEDNIPLFVDNDKIEKVLYNLLSNAFKFTGEGGMNEVSITSLNPPSLSAASLWQEGSGEPPPTLVSSKSGVEIKVSDTGRGIASVKLNHIFDRFYQADDNYAKDQEGTGIGLSLTKELVELHQGRITVESAEGKGTTFTVFLPLGKEHLKPDEVVKSVESVKLDDWDGSTDQINEIQDQVTIKDDDTEKDDTKPLLLIVEDNDDLRSYVRSYLTEDYLITEAIDGEMGLNKAIYKIPDLIVSDVMMPKMDGYELCKKVKSDERTSHIPVILLTAKAAREDKLEGLETGADDFLTKPFDPDELLVRIRNLIQQRKKWKEIILKNIGSANQLSSSGITSMDQKFLQKAIDIVEKHISDGEFSVELFGQEMAMSRVQLHRKLTALVEQSASEFIRTIRLNKAAIQLKEKSDNIAEIAYGVGFSNPSYFSECFKKQFGILPSEYTD